MLGNESQAPMMGRIRRAGAVALVLSAGIPGLAANLAAQQAPTQAPAQAPAKPAKKATPPPAAAAQAGSKNSWVKLCEKAPLGTMYNNGKQETRYATYCITQHERIDGNTGRSVVTAAIRQMEGESKQFFMVMVPLGMMQAGLARRTLPQGSLGEGAEERKRR